MTEPILRCRTGGPALLDDEFEELADAPIKAAEALLLQPMRQGAAEQVFRQGFGRTPPEAFAPQRAKLRHIERREPGEFGVDIGQSGGRVPRHRIREFRHRTSGPRQSLVARDAAARSLRLLAAPLD